MLKKLRLLYQVIGTKFFSTNSLFSVSVDLTERCNSRCTICELWKKENPHTLSLDVFEDQLKNSKVLQKVSLFNLGGGEPFVLKNLFDYIAVIAKYGTAMEVRIVTNGFQSKKIAEVIERVMQETKLTIGIKISLDGGKDTHEKIRGIAKSYELVMKTSAMLSELKLKYPSRLKINYGFTVTDENTSELDAVFETANQLNLGFFYKPILAPAKFEKSKVSESECLSAESINKIKQFSKKYEKEVKFNFLDRKIYKIFNNTLRSYLDYPERLVTCYAGSISCYITADGNVSPCLMLDDTMGNLNTIDFDTLWKSTDSRKVRRKVERSDCHCLTPCDTFPSIIVDKFPFYT